MFEFDFLSMARVALIFLEKYQFSILRICIGILFLWFGALKFFPGVSPAEALATETVDLITFKLLPRPFLYLTLAILEFSMGILLVFTKEYKVTFWLLLFHMICTILPLFILQDVTFVHFPYQLTIEGQYIVKNIVIISAAMVLLFNGKQSKA